jgi:hypothetical protein
VCRVCAGCGRGRSGFVQPMYVACRTPRPTRSVFRNGHCTQDVRTAERSRHLGRRACGMPS